jgi:hypothetical protein
MKIMCFGDEPCIGDHSKGRDGLETNQDTGSQMHIIDLMNFEDATGYPGFRQATITNIFSQNQDSSESTRKSRGTNMYTLSR